jgi:hypothetical protein
MKTIFLLLKTAKADQVKEFKDFNEFNQSNKKLDILQNIFNNEKFINENKTILVNQDQEHSAIAKRLYDRLKIISQNSDMSEKLIIAECKTPEQVIAAMLLLKMTGNAVGEQGKINIVTLSESAKDLQNLKETLSKLLKNANYKKHIKSCGGLMIQIAKSDTARRGGMGVKHLQEQAIKDVAQLCTENELPFSIFHGGGDPVQRGGGKFTELPYFTGALVSQVNGAGKYYKSTTTTVQGHQPQFTVDDPNILTGYLAQSLYTALRLKGYLTSWNESKQSFLTLKQDTTEKYSPWEKFCEKAQTEYIKLFGDAGENKGHDAIKRLLEGAPYLARALANNSSRAIKRTQSEEDKSISTSQETIKDLTGNKDLLDRRSISVQKLCFHSGTNAVALGGILKAFEDTNPHLLQQMYKNDKSFRDFIRLTAITLAQTNFDVSWQMLIGEKKPDQETITQLASKFDADNPTGDYINKQTLAWLQENARQLDGFIYQTLGKAPHKNYNIGDALKEFWPDIYAEIDFAKKLAIAPAMLLAQQTNQLHNQLQQKPDAILTEESRKLLQLLYAGADSRSGMPAAINLTATLDRFCQNSLPIQSRL